MEGSKGGAVATRRALNSPDPPARGRVAFIQPTENIKEKQVLQFGIRLSLTKYYDTVLRNIPTHVHTYIHTCIHGFTLIRAL